MRIYLIKASYQKEIISEGWVGRGSVKVRFKKGEWENGWERKKV